MSDQDQARTDAGIAVRNAGFLVAQTGSLFITGLLFAIIIPRLMGPDTFGQFALITSASLWLTMLGGVSAVQTMVRFVPEFTARNDGDGLRKFFGGVLAIRMVNSVLIAATYSILAILLFPDLDRRAIAAVAIALLFRSTVRLIFALFLGLNQAARWGAGETLSRWTSLIVIIPGTYYGGLVGACVATLIAELVVLGVGLRWAAPYLSWAGLRPDRRFITPFVRYALLFHGSNVILALSQNSGEILVRLVSGDYTQVGYFGVAYRIFAMASFAVWQFTLAFGPLLTTLKTRGLDDDIKSWVGRLLKFGAIGGVMVVASTMFIGQSAIRLALGEDYAPVATHLLPLTLALVMYSLGFTARLLALTYERPGIATKASVIHFAGFIGLGIPLVARGGSVAACVAVFAASAAYSIYFTYRIRSDIRYSLREWTYPVLVAIPLLLPLMWFRSSPVADLALLVGFLSLYTGVLFMLGILKPSDIAGVRHTFYLGTARGSNSPARTDF